MLTRRSVILLFCAFAMTFISRDLRAQENLRSHLIGVRSAYGFIIPHRSIMQNIITGHVPQVEFFYERRALGWKQWERTHNYPTIGVNLYHAELGNQEQLGFASGLFPYISFPIGTPFKKVRYTFRVGTGLGYISKRFDQQDNHQNTTIGSHLNALIQLQSQVHFDIGSSFTAGLGLSFTHFSNASARVPNLGINIPGLQGSIAYRYRSGQPKGMKQDEVEWQPRGRFFVVGSSGFKETYPAGGVKYMAYALQGMYMRDFSQKSSYNIGIDVMYNSSLVFRWEQDNPELDNNFAMTQIGLNGGWTYRVGDFDITLQTGIYLLSKFKTDGATYNRIGYRWHFKDKFWLGTRLKTHGPKADYFEIAVGYRVK